MTVGTCVDCGMAIVGEVLRCPACHQRHAEDLAIEDITTPRERAKTSSAIQILLRWFIVVQVAAIAAVGLTLAVKGCR